MRVAVTSHTKKSATSAASRSTALGGGLEATLQACSQHAGKPKANELASSGDSIEPANRRTEHDAGSAPLPAFPSVTEELAPVGSRQHGPSEWGVSYAAVLVETRRSSPRPWIRTRPKPVSLPRQPMGACLMTCPGVWVTSQVAPRTGGQHLPTSRTAS